MNAKQFFELVSEMRQAQKEYFKFKTSDSLNRSKRLERQIDCEINRVNSILDKSNNQQSLFEEVK